MVDKWKGFLYLLALVCLVYQGVCEPACPANQANNTIHVCRAENVTHDFVHIDTDGSPENSNITCWCAVQRADSSNQLLPVKIESRPGPSNTERNSMMFTIDRWDFHNFPNNSMEYAIDSTNLHIRFKRTGSSASMCLSIHRRSTNNDYSTPAQIRVECNPIDRAILDDTGIVSIRPLTTYPSFHQSVSINMSEDRTSESTNTSMVIATKSTPTPTPLARTSVSTQTPETVTSELSQTPTPIGGISEPIKTPVTRTSESLTLASTERSSPSTSVLTQISMVRTTESTNNSKSLVSDDTTVVVIVAGCVFGVVVVVASSLVIILCKRKCRRLKLSTTQQGNHGQAAPRSNYYTTENRNYVPAEVCTFSNQKTLVEEHDVLLHVRGNSSALPDNTYAEIGETSQQDKCAYAQVCKCTDLKRATERKDESHASNESNAAESVYNVTTAAPTVGVTNTPNDNIYNTFVVEDDYNHLHEVVNPKITSNNIYGAASDVTHKA